MKTSKLCDPCARDTAVKGRCEKLTLINRPGTICDRCLSDGRLLVSYRICCQPEARFGHTAECKKTRGLDVSPVLRRFAVALFSTDSRILALTRELILDDPDKRLATIGRAWDLAADGHEPEATCRKEAEDRAFRMQKFDRELSEYVTETKRLTRESTAKAALKAGQETNGRLPPPIPRAEHEANLAKYRAEENERDRLYSLRELQEREAEDERKRQERAERKAEHPQCGAASPIGKHPDSASPIGKHPDFKSLFGEERCTRQKHDYGDHQFIVNGRVISGWNANSYYVGDDPARATSRTQRSVIQESSGPAAGVPNPRYGVSVGGTYPLAFRTDCKNSRCGLCDECKYRGHRP